MVKPFFVKLNLKVIAKHAIGGTESRCIALAISKLCAPAILPFGKSTTGPVWIGTENRGSLSDTGLRALDSLGPSDSLFRQR
jgi:hypothetical protein